MLWSVQNFLYQINTFFSGRYTVMWAWWFNSKDDSNLYTSCWEADIVDTRQERDDLLANRGQSTAVAGKAICPI